MQRTLKEHLDDLRLRQEVLSAELSKSIGREQGNNLESELRAVALAIAHFEAAIKIERELVQKSG